MCLADLSRYGLTRREQQVVAGIARGLEIKEIAQEAGINYNTAKMHIYRAKRRMGVRNQLEVAIVAHGGRPDNLETPTAAYPTEQAPSWSTERYSGRWH